MMATTTQPAAVRDVLGNPALLAQIVGHLDDGRARDLVRVLSVSRAFFDAAATTLCRRIEVPLYEYSRTKEREQYLVDDSCYSYDGDRAAHYRPPTNATAHRSLEPGVSRQRLNRINTMYYRSVFPATPMMKELYKHVHVVTVEQHVLCDRSAISHPLPLVRTVIVRGGHNEVCLTSKDGMACGFLPQHPFRLVLDGLCGGWICRACTSPEIFTPYAETLVLRLQHHRYYFECKARNLPRNFNPRRLVLQFPQELRANGYYHVERELEAQPALGPGQGGKTHANMFYRIAKMCLLAGKDCQIYVVAADQAALHYKGLERHDPSLAQYMPKPQQPKQRETHHSNGFVLPAGAHWVLDRQNVEATRWMDRNGGLHSIEEILEYRNYYNDASFDLGLSQGYALPLGAHWILDSDHVEATRWLDRDGQVHFIDEILEMREDNDDGQYDTSRQADYWRYKSGSLGTCYGACYSQNGQIVSATRPRKLSPQQLPTARTIIEKRVAVIERLVHQWIDHILDSRMPLEHWHEEESSGKWENREQFERHLFNLKAAKDQEMNQKWHDNHRCWAGCRDDLQPEVPESEDEDEDGNLIVEEVKEVYGNYGPSWIEKRGDGSKRIVEAKKWRRSRKFHKTKDEIESLRKLKHASIQFISTFEYHKMEGNNDEVDDPSKYL